MNPHEKIPITVQVTIDAPVKKVWNFFTSPDHIIKWNNASPDWHTPKASNDLQAGGKFLYRMEARDGSFGFDYEGQYDEVQTDERILYTLGDGRKVSITFKPLNNQTEVVEIFEAETENSVELQRQGWQNILDNFRKYVEANS